MRKAKLFDSGNGVSMFILAFVISGGALVWLGMLAHSQEVEDEYQAWKLAEKYAIIAVWKAK
jgi:hypothetical protein